MIDNNPLTLPAESVSASAGQLDGFAHLSQEFFLLHNVEFVGSQTPAYIGISTI